MLYNLRSMTGDQVISAREGKVHGIRGGQFTETCANILSNPKYQNVAEGVAMHQTTTKDRTSGVHHVNTAYVNVPHVALGEVLDELEKQGLKLEFFVRGQQGRFGNHS